MEKGRQHHKNIRLLFFFPCRIRMIWNIRIYAKTINTHKTKSYQSTNIISNLLRFIHEHRTMSACFHELLQQKNNDCKSEPDGSPCEQPVVSWFMNSRLRPLLLSLSGGPTRWRHSCHFGLDLWYCFLNDPVDCRWILQLFPSSCKFSRFRSYLDIRLLVGRFLVRDIWRTRLRDRRRLTQHVFVNLRYKGAD